MSIFLVTVSRLHSGDLRIVSTADDISSSDGNSLIILISMVHVRVSSLNILSVKSFIVLKGKVDSMIGHEGGIYRDNLDSRRKCQK